MCGVPEINHHKEGRGKREEGAEINRDRDRDRKERSGGIDIGEERLGHELATSYYANGVELQSPVSRSARWVGKGKNYEPQRGSTKMVIVMGNILKAKP